MDTVIDTKTVVTALSSVLLAAGGTAAMYTGQVADLEADKQEVLKQYVYAQARIGEIPTLDLSTVSTDEMSKAFSDLATENNAKETPNLFDNLAQDAIKKGVSCLK